MNVIFLDIHGVMNTANHKIISFEHSGHEFDPECVDNLKQIIEATKSKVVITSSIRLNKSIFELKRIFSPYGLSNYVIDKTPRTGSYRSSDIRSYIKKSQDSNKHKVTNFIILDDDKKLYNDYYDRLIITNSNLGINEEVKIRAVSLLKGENSIE